MKKTNRYGEYRHPKYAGTYIDYFEPKKVRRVPLEFLPFVKEKISEPELLLKIHDKYPHLAVSQLFKVLIVVNLKGLKFVRNEVKLSDKKTIETALGHVISNWIPFIPYQVGENTIEKYKECVEIHNGFGIFKEILYPFIEALTLDMERNHFKTKVTDITLSNVTLLMNPLTVLNNIQSYLTLSEDGSPIDVIDDGNDIDIQIMKLAVHPVSGATYNFRLVKH